jgi:hypothetical protein
MHLVRPADRHDPGLCPLRSRVLFPEIHGTKGTKRQDIFRAVLVWLIATLKG